MNLRLFKTFKTSADTLYLSIEAAAPGTATQAETLSSSESGL